MLNPSGSFPRVAPLAESGLLVTFGDALSVPLSRRIAALTESILALELPGVVDLVPAYTTLTLLFDPERADPDAIERTVRERWAAAPTESETAGARQVTIPVAYGGADGPDLEEVAAHAGLAPNDLVRRHSAAPYTVAALGFAPGFAFLLGLPPELATPRRAEPRTRVPPGSVGIGAAQTGVYALPTPGGWNLVGRTRRRLFDPAAAERGADPFTLHVGDEVRFEAVSADAMEPAGEAPPPEGDDRAAASDQPCIEVLEPGLLTTVQDLGRPGQGRFGVSPGGAADRGAVLLGNRLAGNDAGVAVLEITLLGPRLRFAALDRSHRAALTGADLGARLNGVPIRPGQAFTVGDGDELSFDPGRADHSQVRAYLCLAGGIDVPVVLGSRATDLLAGFGGWHGRALKAGDRLRVGTVPTSHPSPLPTSPDTGEEHPPSLGEGESGRPFVPSPPQGRGSARQRRGEGAPAEVSARSLRFVRGPQADRFDDEAFAAFTGQLYTVTARSDRVGLRLRGPALRPEGGADVISEGVTTGAIQVAGDGQPIVMLPARATVGGYARIGTVVGADLDRLAQLPPGATVRFEEVLVDEARALTLAARHMLMGDADDDNAVTAMEEEQAGMEQDEERDFTDETGLGQGVAATDAAIAARLAEVAAGGTWDPDGVRRIIRALAETGVTRFELRVESAGLHLRVERGGEGGDDGGGRTAASGRLAGEAESGMGGAEPVGIDEGGIDPSMATGDEATTVTAPMLGVFYRRPSPNDPLFAQAGETIEEGQAIGVIEVMKSFHEVQAPHAGTFDAYLADDGQTVEFGAPLARLYRPDASQRD